MVQPHSAANREQFVDTMIGHSAAAVAQDSQRSDPAPTRW